MPRTEPGALWWRRRFELAAPQRGQPAVEDFQRMLLHLHDVRLRYRRLPLATDGEKSWSLLPDLSLPDLSTPRLPRSAYRGRTRGTPLISGRGRFVCSTVPPLGIEPARWRWMMLSLGRLDRATADPGCLGFIGLRLPPGTERHCEPDSRGSPVRAVTRPDPSREHPPTRADLRPCGSSAVTSASAVGNRIGLSRQVGTWLLPAQTPAADVGPFVPFAPGAPILAVRRHGPRTRPCMRRRVLGVRGRRPVRGSAVAFARPSLECE